MLNMSTTFIECSHIKIQIYFRYMEVNHSTLIMCQRFSIGINFEFITSQNPNLQRFSFTLIIQYVIYNKNFRCLIIITALVKYIATQQQVAISMPKQHILCVLLRTTRFSKCIYCRVLSVYTNVFPKQIKITIRRDGTFPLFSYEISSLILSFFYFCLLKVLRCLSLFHCLAPKNFARNYIGIPFQNRKKKGIFPKQCNTMSYRVYLIYGKNSYFDSQIEKKNHVDL